MNISPKRSSKVKIAYHFCSLTQVGSALAKPPVQGQGKCTEKQSLQPPPKEPSNHRQNVPKEVMQAIHPFCYFSVKSIVLRESVFFAQYTLTVKLRSKICYKKIQTKTNLIRKLTQIIMLILNDYVELLLVLKNTFDTFLSEKQVIRHIEYNLF